MTSVASFISGLDLSSYKCEDCAFGQLKSLQSLRWLKVNDVDLQTLPYEISKLRQLESLHLKRNKLRSLRHPLVEMKNLRELVMRENRLHAKSMQDYLANMENLTVLDLSANDLEIVPDSLSNALNLRVLNLSSNRIKNFPVFMCTLLKKLTWLDLSSNEIESLPVQIQRLSSIKSLNLANNPMERFHFRHVKPLVHIEHFDVSQTHCTVDNFPNFLDSYASLSDFRCSRNELQRIPSSVYLLTNLKRLDISDNKISVLGSEVENLQNLEHLNISRNQLKFLPPSLMMLRRLKSFYVNSNRLEFDGVPTGVFNLCSLEIFSASDNRLQLIPEGLFRCPRLRKLFLANNELLTLPDTVYCANLEVLDVSGNNNFSMPPQPPVRSKGAANLDYLVNYNGNDYNEMVDPFGLLSRKSGPHSDRAARRRRLKNLRSGRTSIVKLETLKKIQRNPESYAKNMNGTSSDSYTLDSDPNSKSKSQNGLVHPTLNYSDYFEPTVGYQPGILCWEIDNFIPIPTDEGAKGIFYKGDCYIILQTTMQDNEVFNHQIFYLIGKDSSLDKQACAAVHAVNLRNMLRSTCRTIRVEEGDESYPFRLLFPKRQYLSGTKTHSGFYCYREQKSPLKTYRLSGLRHPDIEFVETAYENLTEDTVFLIKTQDAIFLRFGSLCNPVTTSTFRLFAEELNRSEMKGRAAIYQVRSGKEPKDFWRLIGGPPVNDYKVPLHVTKTNNSESIHLLKVLLVKSYFELEQVRLKHKANRFEKSSLDSHHVYILDCPAGLFTWFGSHSSRLARAAALKLSRVVSKICPRFCHKNTYCNFQGYESIVFTSYFDNWSDSTISSAASGDKLANTPGQDGTHVNGADNKTPAALKPEAADLSALFRERTQVMTEEESQRLMTEYNENLINGRMDAYVFDGKMFTKLPDDQYGIFYTKDSYVYFARYITYESDSEQSEQQSLTDEEMDGETVPSDQNENYVADEGERNSQIEHVVYFWQGRESNNLAWLLFQFQIKNKFKDTISRELQVFRFHQQREHIGFLAHFQRQMIIRNGSVFDERRDDTEFFQMRWKYSSICSRCIQIATESSRLCSQFSFILKSAKEAPYVWHGSKCSEIDRELVVGLAKRLYKVDAIEIEEGDETENFWSLLGGKQPYDTNAEYLYNSRLFKCSNDKGYFTVSEKWADFCQDDLDDDDVMLLDTGSDIFIWVGSSASEMEVKMAFKAAQAYFHKVNGSMQPQGKPRPKGTIRFSAKGRESIEFTRCFHGWANHIVAPTQLERRPVVA